MATFYILCVLLITPHLITSQPDEDHHEDHKGHHDHDDDTEHTGHSHLEITPNEDFMVKEGEQIRIQCACHDETEISWQRDGQAPSLEATITQSQPSDHKITSELVIESAVLADSGTYACRDGDKAHNAVKSVTVTVASQSHPSGAPGVKGITVSTLLCMLTALVLH